MEYVGQRRRPSQSRNPKNERSVEQSKAWSSTRVHSPYFVTNAESMKPKRNPYILIYEKKITNVQDLLPLLRRLPGRQAPRDIARILRRSPRHTVVNKLRGILTAAVSPCLAKA